MNLPVYAATRYVVPLREGGSLPAILETEEQGLFVAKFRGAGQGARALVSELIAGLIALWVGLPVPEIALLHLDAAFGRTERDPEIQDILKGSRGLNAGLRYLEGAFTYDPVAVPDLISAAFAADVVWLDAYVTNIDRTARNANILVWQRSPWLIDHGAALYFHHDWPGVDDERVRTPFTPIRQHVLLPAAGDLREADARMMRRLTPAVLEEIIALVPDALLMDAPEGREPPFPSAAANRAAYLAYLTRRLEAPRPFLEEAERARAALLRDAPAPQPYRR